MKALVFENGELALTELPPPAPEPGEAVIRVLSAGICNTDIEITRGYMAFTGIPGHEFVGVVEQSDNPALAGKRVVGEINCACGICRYCQLEMPNHCLNRSVLGILQRNGAFAEYTRLPEGNLHLVPDEMSDAVAVFTEPCAAAFRILEQVEVADQDRIIVLGDGKLGQLVAQVLWLRSKHLVCVGRHRDKLKRLSELHIDTAHLDDPLDGGADLVVEASGAPEGLQRALELVRPEGTVVLKTTAADQTCLDMSLPVINEVRVVGSRCGPFRPALEALALGTVEVEPMVSEVYPLEDGVAAMARAMEPGVMKVLLRMGE